MTDTIPSEAKNARSTQMLHTLQFGFPSAEKSSKTHHVNVF